MMMPRSIILDPGITKYAPENLWLGSGTRAMDHGIEAVCSIRGNALVERVCLAGLRYLHDGLLRDLNVCTTGVEESDQIYNGAIEAVYQGHTKDALNHRA